MRWMRAFWLVFNRSGFCHMDRFSRNGHKPLCNWKCEKETRKYSHTLLKKKKLLNKSPNEWLQSWKTKKMYYSKYNFYYDLETSETRRGESQESIYDFALLEKVYHLTSVFKRKNDKIYTRHCCKRMSRLSQLQNMHLNLLTIWLSLTFKAGQRQFFVE